MELNYHHLRYFHAVAQTGSVVSASKRLLVAKATISSQIKQLERSIGGELFQRRGRALELTSLGRHIFHYADEIFRIGRDLETSLTSGRTNRPPPLNIGVANSVAKSIAYNLLSPLIADDAGSQVTVSENETDQLLAQLAIHQLDLIISDASLPSTLDFTCRERHLGNSAIGIFANKLLTEQLRAEFPKSLTGAPFLALTGSSAVGREIEAWLRRNDLEPTIVGRFENSALLKSFAANGHGCFAAPMTVSVHLSTTYDLRCLGYISEVVADYYALFHDSRLRHPGIDKLIASAQQFLQQENLRKER